MPFTEMGSGRGEGDPLLGPGSSSSGTEGTAAGGLLGEPGHGRTLGPCPLVSSLGP